MTTLRLAPACALAIAVCAVPALQRATPNQPSPCFHYEPQIVKLRGEVVRVPRYGPPGFGENPKTDEKVNVAILVPSHPIDVCGDSTSEKNGWSFHDVREIQLFYPDSLDLTPFIGRPVVVTGALFQRLTAHHYTDVLLRLNTIRTEASRPCGTPGHGASASGADWRRSQP
jgi:hypothetical protein